MKAIALRAENLLATLALGGIMLLPLAEIAVAASSSAAASRARRRSRQNLTLWVGMLGAAIAAREGKLLTLATGEFLPKGPHRRRRARHRRHRRRRGRRRSSRSAASRSCGASATAGDVIAVGVPTWVADLALPIGFGADRAPARLARVAALDRPRHRRARHRRRRLLMHEHRRLARGPGAAGPGSSMVARRRRARRADLRAARRHRDVRVLHATAARRSCR